MIMNNCKYLTFRSKNYQKYTYCRYKKSKIDLQDCKECETKFYKEIKKVSHNPKPRTKSLAIPKQVKEIVWNRDNHKCIECGKYVPVECACCHFIARSQGGLGIEQNILTLCNDCHYNYDQTENRKILKEKYAKYLQNKYKDWAEKDLYYKKY